ncbi:diadenylate cyclase CdaA [Caldibacillus thermolactis]|jgi:diadenylate cyclase|uniref:Diadenylate cyclase n=1 Tax=Pallidibacillus thermolactis TaxID=251051 RepID=A0ABT2WJK2_9BACI|nr:diadenylate cyclase CdaA [Pallidibacillus thermolactis]MCU9595587.1 diadenylate cyclase CdaA [Pallidibacillus thermolactis]MCU9600941.1 diadenylate cyclase CdaA [Pallidibacillus thermolactis subsp. kokeshiiformis]MED1674395.1 diadenylate cyclase CdaA [Pallidibacillus thermolactis subsp. kokeshiiformis]
MLFANFFEDFTILDYIASIVDILVVWYILYKIFMIVRGTKAVQLINGIFIILVLRGLSDLFGLRTLGWLMEQVIDWGFLAIIIIFQPELRRALEHLGRGKIFTRARQKEAEKQEQVVNAIVKACEYMGKRRIGALISIAQETGLNDYIETGIPLNANVSSELLINTFIPNTPLHDGAVIIQDYEIKAAACYLPLSESPFIPKELGTRHRAAIGISEVTDSITVVISEETGGISLTKNGELHRDITLDQLKDMLADRLMKSEPPTTANLWSKWVKK